MATVDLELQIASQAKQIVLIASILLIILVITSVLLRDRVPKLKTWLFGMISTTLLIPTLFIIVNTIRINVQSESGGPAHWHAGVEFWVCGAELELRNPTGLLSNKIGTSTYHEHDDKFIHLEGVVMRRQHDASLGKFMSVTGGYLNKAGMGIPLNSDESNWFASNDKLDGDHQYIENFTLATAAGDRISHNQDGPVINLKNGEYCSSDTEESAELQTFVYTFNKANNTYSQHKLASSGDAANYAIREESSLGPPSDCIIFEFDKPKDRTDKLCEQYGVRDKDRCIEFGVKPENKSAVCDIKEVTVGSNNG